MTIGIVTCKRVGDLTDIDRELLPIFQSKDIDAIPVVWNDASVNWNRFDCLILRSVWDYHILYEEFLKWLNFLDEQNIPLLNSTSVVRKNHHKFYLRELRNSGINVVPTLFYDSCPQLDLSNTRNMPWEKMVIKPAISASSFHTELFGINELESIENKFRPIAKSRDLLVQQFMPEVQTYGELSILFFNRKYSHTVLKTAQNNDFRVQSEFGGSVRLISPPKKILNEATEILSYFSGDILQARVDGIIRDNSFMLMEIELIEPHLFF